VNAAPALAAELDRVADSIATLSWPIAETARRPVAQGGALATSVAHLVALSRHECVAVENSLRAAADACRARAAPIVW